MNEIVRYRREVRALVLALGVPLAAIGAWALVAPSSFYEDFPGGGRHWVSALGPYNEHMTRDFGSLYLGLGLLLVFAAVVLERRLVQGALGALLVFSVPHFVYHATELEAMSTGDNVANMTTLALSVVVPLVLLWLVRRPRAASPRVAEPDSKAAFERGGVRYGTR
jgi:hypothetical protein